jgi:hypothetical protein
LKLKIDTEKNFILIEVYVSNENMKIEYGRNENDIIHLELHMIENLTINDKNMDTENGFEIEFFTMIEISSKMKFSENENYMMKIEF